MGFFLFSTLCDDRELFIFHEVHFTATVRFLLFGTLYGDRELYLLYGDRKLYLLYSDCVLFTFQYVYTLRRP